MTARFIPNNAGIAAIGKSTMVIAKVKEAADAIAETAAGIAPVGATGDLAAGIVAEQSGSEVKVVGHDFKTGFYEFGTINNRAYHMLTQGAEQNGYRVVGGW